MEPTYSIAAEQTVQLKGLKRYERTEWQLPSLLSRPLSILGSLPGAVDALPRLLTRPRWQVGEGTYGVVYKADDKVTSWH